jgi:hypothetical protein
MSHGTDEGGTRFGLERDISVISGISGIGSIGAQVGPQGLGKGL